MNVIVTVHEPDAETVAPEAQVPPVTEKSVESSPATVMPSVSISMSAAPVLESVAVTDVEVDPTVVVSKESVDGANSGDAVGVMNVFVDSMKLGTVVLPL